MSKHLGELPLKCRASWEGCSWPNTIYPKSATHGESNADTQTLVSSAI